MPLAYKQEQFSNYKILKKVTNELIFYYLNDIAEAMDTSPLWELST